jgi:two-component system, NtrC family, sensor kinase
MDAESPPSERARPRVLVIDDDAAVARAIARILSAEHDVSVEIDAGKAIECIQDGERYDAIVCDLTMTPVSGVDVYCALRRCAPELLLHLAFVTGGVFTAAAHELVATTKCPILSKPFARGDLLALVRRLTG